MHTVDMFQQQLDADIAEEVSGLEYLFGLAFSHSCSKCRLHCELSSSVLICCPLVTSLFPSNL